MFFKYYCFGASVPDCLVTIRMLTSVYFIIKHRPTVHQVSEIATANMSAGTVCVATETCHSFVLLLFLYSKLNRLTAAKKLSGDACQTLGVSCDQTSAGIEKSVVGRGEISDLFSLNIFFTLKGTDEFLNYSQYWKLIIVSNSGSSRV